MISRRYKLIYDTANCIMIYLLGLAAAIGACALMRRKFSWQYAITSAVVLAAFVAIRLFVQQMIVSAIAHIIIIVACWFIFVNNASDSFNGIIIVTFAALLAAIDVFADFYKKKNQSYGEIHVIACALFLPVYAYVDYVANRLSVSSDMTEAKYGATCGIFGTVICVICIVFFGLTLVRAYMKNAIKLADNSQIDENAPVNYMYGNSNKFIGPIIAFIIAIMLVIQSKTSSNIFASMWLGLLGGVAGVCNLFASVNSDNVVNGTQVAPAGSTLFWVEVVIAGVILAAIVIAIIVIITKLYKSHWHKDISSDETLESAAMVERREWIYHKTSKKAAVVEDTSVTSAQEIPEEAMQAPVEEAPVQQEEAAESETE